MGFIRFESVGKVNKSRSDGDDGGAAAAAARRRLVGAGGQSAGRKFPTASTAHWPTGLAVDGAQISHRHNVILSRTLFSYYRCSAVLFSFSFSFFFAFGCGLVFLLFFFSSRAAPVLYWRWNSALISRPACETIPPVFIGVFFPNWAKIWDEFSVTRLVLSFLQRPPSRHVAIVSIGPRNLHSILK